VLFTDIVGSTELARELGDVRWTRPLAAQRKIVREELRLHHGREVDTAGDGFFAVFESPTEAVRCAFAATRAVQEIGLDIRAGVHFGEIELEGDNVQGMVVHTGARVMSQGGAAEVLITQTVKDLVRRRTPGNRRTRARHASRGFPAPGSCSTCWRSTDRCIPCRSSRPRSRRSAASGRRRENRRRPARAGSFRPSRR
jgi:class 3 adenylate cyclase